MEMKKGASKGKHSIIITSLSWGNTRARGKSRSPTTGAIAVSLVNPTGQRLNDPSSSLFPPLRRQFRPTEINAGFSIIKNMRCSCCLLHIATCMPTAYRSIHKLSWPPIVLFVGLVNKQTSNPGRELSVIVSFVYATALGGAMCRREERSRVERREETCAKVRTDQEVRRG